MAEVPAELTRLLDRQAPAVKKRLVATHDFHRGAVTIADRKTFDRLGYEEETTEGADVYFTADGAQSRKPGVASSTKHYCVGSIVLDEPIGFVVESYS